MNAINVTGHPPHPTPPHSDWFGWRSRAWRSRAWYLWVSILGAEKTHGLGICRVNRLEDYELFGLSGDLSKLEQTN